VNVELSSPNMRKASAKHIAYWQERRKAMIESKGDNKMNGKEKMTMNVCIIGVFIMIAIFAAMCYTNMIGSIYGGLFVLSMFIYTVVFWYYIHWLNKKYNIKYRRTVLNS